MIVHTYTEALQALRNWRDTLKASDFARAWTIECKPLKHKRSSEQNRRYWAILHQIAEQLPAQLDGVYHRPELFHEYFRTKFLGYDELDLDREKVLLSRSTTSLSVGEFTDYMTQIEVWAAEHDVEIDG